MRGRLSKSLCYCTLAVLLLGACSKTPESPVAKTNQNPTKRYEITVELVDPPADIKRISGEAHFSIPDVACMPTPDRVAGYTPGSSHIENFALTYAGGNTYKGHIFLDWPVDEDYYGLGICKWELAAVATVLIRRSGLMQAADLLGTEVKSESSNRSFCPEEMRDKFDKICLTPIDPELIKKLEPVSYIVSMSSRKN